MNFQALLSQMPVLLDPRVKSCSETGAPSGLFVCSNGQRICAGPSPELHDLKCDIGSIQTFFSKYAKKLKQHSVHLKVLFKATKIPEGPLSDELQKVKRILIWGDIRTKEMAPLLFLFQTEHTRITELLEVQEARWKELDSEICWNEFLFICRKKLDVHALIYLTLSFKDPNIATLKKLQSYLHEFEIPNGQEILALFATSIYKNSSGYEAAAIELIMEHEPKVNLDILGEFEADFSAKILYQWKLKNNSFQAIYSPNLSSEQIAKLKKSNSRNPLPKWSHQIHELPKFGLNEKIKKFRSLPKHLQEFGMQLIQKGKRKLYFSNGTHYSRTDLMILYFLYHADQLLPKEFFQVNEMTFQLNDKQLMGCALRAYIEHDFEITPSDFESLVERAEIRVWKNGIAKNILVEQIDPLELTMDLLTKEVNWIPTLYFMENVHQKLRK